MGPGQQGMVGVGRRDIGSGLRAQSGGRQGDFYEFPSWEG
jgi:hypothetical protein